MKWMIRLLGYLSALFLLFGCLPKRAFYFFPSNQTFSHQQQGEARKPVAAHSPNAPVLLAEQVQPDHLSFTAAAHSEVLVPAKFSQVPPAAAEAKVQPNKAASPGRANAKALTLQKAATKKFTRNTEGKRRIHWAAAISLLLALLGLVSLLVTFTLAEPLLPFTIAFLSLIGAELTGIFGIKKIKKKPTQFTGQGLAVAGLIISTLMLVISLLLASYILSFAGVFV